MQKRNSTRWSVIIFGVLMSAVIGLSVLSGWFLQLAQQRDFVRQQQAAAQPTAVPTFQPPVDTTLITLEREVVQANGLFSVDVPQPPEWQTVESSYEPLFNRARLVMSDPLHVIEVLAEEPTEPIEDVNALTDLFNAQALNTSWRSYRSWRETQRGIINENDTDYLQIDFELQLNNRTYLARQRSWLQDGLVYSVRVVTPDNASDLLRFLMTSVTQSVEPLQIFAGTPVSWKAYYDASLSHAIRFPLEWTVTDAAEGFPASVEGENVRLRVEAINEQSIADEDAASEFVAALSGVSEILSVSPTERGDLSGFVVSYRSQDLDGRNGSGAAVLLNGEGALHVANLNVTNLTADFNEAEPSADTQQYVDVLASFMPLSGVEFAPIGSGNNAPINPNANSGVPGGFGF